MRRLKVDDFYVGSRQLLRGRRLEVKKHNRLAERVELRIGGGRQRTIVRGHRIGQKYLTVDAAYERLEEEDRERIGLHQCNPMNRLAAIPGSEVEINGRNHIIALL